MKISNLVEAKTVDGMTIYLVKCSKCYNYFKSDRYGAKRICPICKSRIVVGEYS